MQYCAQCRRVYSEETQYCPIHGSQLERREEFADGAKVCDRYEVLGLIGSGAMGQVFLVRDLQIDQGDAQRAVKIPRDSYLTDRNYLEKFRSEAQRTLSLFHPNIVRSYNVETTESGVPFLLMEYLNGHELRYWMEREPRLQWRHIREIALDIARALESAHAAGITHCDMKPESVRGVTRNHPTPVKVYDFGLAKAAQVMVDASSPSGAGTVLGGEAIAGTLNYMAPEQAIARNRVGPTSDIYSFGVILFELITGRLPYPDMASAAEARRLHANQLPETLPSSARCPAGVAGLVQSMLDRSPERRPSASNVVRALESFAESLDGRTKEERNNKTEPIIIPFEKGQPSKRPLWMILSVAAAIVIIVAIILVANRRPNDLSQINTPPPGTSGGRSAPPEGNPDPQPLKVTSPAWMARASRLQWPRRNCPELPSRATLRVPGISTARRRTPQRFQYMSAATVFARS